MADATFTPGYKFVSGICLKECAARGKDCEDCIRFSKFKPTEKKKGE